MIGDDVYVNVKNHKATISNYYDMQNMQDKLYAESKRGKKFNNLMSLILSPNNIKLAYRSIKSNKGSHTAGTDKKTIEYFKKMNEEEFVAYIQKKLQNYHPKMVKRVEIPKPNGKKRPLGIPCIEDRIIQQCILQILEPICEAKFYEKSYGFRPNRSAENAIAECMRLMQRSHMQYVVDVDIKGFFDNVNHRKLIRQLWTMGITDTTLLQVIKQMLKAPILLTDNTVEYPRKGTPQGGILSPLLANVVLNEFDWWIASQWHTHWKVMKKPPQQQFNKSGERDLAHEYRALRTTNLKEMYIVRYADDFKIFCKTRQDAINIKIAITEWLTHRLKLQVSDEKTGITNLKQKYSDFLGFKLKLRKKSNKNVAKIKMCDKARMRIKENLKNQIKDIQKPESDMQLYARICKYNSMVIGIQNYYCIATHIFEDFREIQFEVRNIMNNRLNTSTQGQFGNKFLQQRYGKSKQVRWLMDKPIVPIGYCKYRNPVGINAKTSPFTPEGREELYKSFDIDIKIMHYLLENPERNMSVEYNDNRISLYSGQCGKCAITGNRLELGNMECHHKVPRESGGDDSYKNLIFVNKEVHILIHSKKEKVISEYLKKLNLSEKGIKKLNKLRVLAGLDEIKKIHE